MGRPVGIVVVGRREPFKMFLLTLCVYTGGRQLWLLGRGGSYDTPLPWWAVAVWLVVLAVFGAVALVGTVWPDPITGLLVERWAVGVIALVAVGVSIGTVLVGGVMDGVVTGGFAVACGVQARRITTGLRAPGRSE